MWYQSFATAINSMYILVMFVMRSATQPKTTAAALLLKYNLQYQYIFIV